jgi:hypothetical protein
MWGSDYPHSESTFPQSRKILAEILAGVQEDERAKIVGGNTALVYDFDLGRLIACSPLGEGAGPAPSRISDVR